MKIDLEKIKEVYGDNTLYEIKDNLEDVIMNLKYLQSRSISNIYEVLERYPYSFLLSPEIFEFQVEELINGLGVEYVEKLEDDMSLWRKIQ